MNQPQELGQKLVSQVIELARNPSGHDELAARRIRREAEGLARVSREYSYMILGCLSYVEHKTADMISFQEKALRLAPSNDQVVDNYAISMFNTGRYEKAVELIESLLSLRGQDDVEIVKKALEFNFSAGLFYQCLKYGEQLERMNKEFILKDEVLALINLLESNGYTEDSTRKYFSLVTKVMTDFDVYPVLRDFWHTNDGYEESVIEVYVSTSPEIAANMNERLAQIIVESNIPVSLALDICFNFVSCDYSDLDKVILRD